MVTATVTTDEAARIVGVSPRTIRRWIQRGVLPAIPTQDGYLISPTALAGVQAGAGQRSRSRGHADTDTATDMLVTVNPNARAQLEAIRDEWLAPLVAQIAAQAERIGQLQAERDELQRRLEAAESALSCQQDGVGRESVTEGAGTPEPPPVAQLHTPGVWRRLRRWWWE